MNMNPRHFAIFTRNKDLVCILRQENEFDAVPAEALKILQDGRYSQLNLPDSLFDVVNISVVDVVATHNLEEYLLRNVA